MRILLSSCVLSLLFVTCSEPASLVDHAAPVSGPELIVDSGFEPNTELFVYNSHVLGFRGTDGSRADAGDWSFHGSGSDVGSFYFKLEEGGTSADRNVEIIHEPQSPANYVVQMILKNPTEPNPSKGRVQMEVGENTAIRDALVSYRLFLSPDYTALTDFTFGAGDWLTLMELWGGPDVPASERYPFRITLYIIKSIDNSQLEFGLRAEKIDRMLLSTGQENWQVVWEQRGDSMFLPVGEWVNLEMHYREGDSSTGSLLLSVQKQNQAKVTVFDIHNVTRHPLDPNPPGLRWINPVKIYCSANVLAHVNGKGKTLSLMFDDFKFWKNKTPD